MHLKVLWPPDSDATRSLTPPTPFNTVTNQRRVWRTWVCCSDSGCLSFICSAWFSHYFSWCQVFFSKVPRVVFFFPPLAAARFVCVLFFQLCFVICLCKSTTPQRLWKHEPLFFFWCASCDYYSWSHMRTAKVIIAVHFASTHCRYNHSRGFAATRRITNLLHTVCRSCFFFFFIPPENTNVSRRNYNEWAFEDALEGCRSLKSANSLRKWALYVHFYCTYHKVKSS